MTNVLITGGTGLVGTHLAKRLLEKGYEVAILSRHKNEKANPRTYSWHPEKNEIDPEAIKRADFIIHLAGAGVADKKWTEKRKQLIIDSRVKTTELLFKKIKEQNRKLKAFISSSAIGYYGTLTSEKIFTENDPPAKDFLGETCRQWEEAVDHFKEIGIRTVKIRTGIVLASKGGALSKMSVPVQLGLGSAIGSGKQYMPWIHIEDLCNMYLKAIEDPQMEGAYNGVAPLPETNKAFTRTLANVLGKPFWLPNVPAFIMKMIFGEMAQILLKGSRVSAEKIISAGYSFKFPTLEKALKDLVRQRNSSTP